MGIINDVPLPGEIEISLFGPGYGESVLVHLGDGTWVVVDSCLDKDKEPYALSYLKNLGICPADSIKFVICSHWHDDHIRGIQQILNEAPNAKFICSSAVKSEDFKRLLCYSFEGVLKPMGSGMDEISKILKKLREHKGERPILAFPSKVLHRDKEQSIEILAHSPSDEAILASFARISDIKDNLNSRRIPNIGANQSSVVISLQVKETSVLLGADLEEHGREGLGWTAVLDSFKTCSSLQSSVFKIPHHGSKNGHHDRVWDEMFDKKPIGILTPYNRGKKLPTADDLKRLDLRCSAVYTTSEVTFPRYKTNDRIVDKALKETARKVEKITSEYSQVRLRKCSDNQESDWIVETFGRAQRLS